MRRENKLALIVGFSVLLVVAVLVSDHLSKARQDEVVDGLDTLSAIPDASLFLETPIRETGRVGDDVARRDPARAGAATPENPPLELVDQRANENREVALSAHDAGSADTQGSRMADAGSAEDDDGPVEFVFGMGRRGDDQRASGEHSSGLSDFIGIDGDSIRGLLNGQPALVQESKSRGETGLGEKLEQRPTAAAAETYVIRENDTLYELCERLYGDGTKWRELVALNKDKVNANGDVRVGLEIVLLPGAARKKAPAEAMPPEGGTRTYTVKKGDTLSEIVMREVGSVRYIDRVRTLNPWLKKQNDNLRVGQTLTLPARRHASARGR